MHIEINGYSKEATDEIVFLVKYLADLEDEGFTIKDSIAILIAVFTTYLEGRQVKLSSLEGIFASIKYGFMRTRQHRKEELE